MKHNKFNEAKILIEAGVSVMLTGKKGSGKTTIIEQVAKSLKLPFYAISMTRQTTLSLLMGYRNVNGEYVPSQLREAVQNGGIFLLDEIDAGDANVLLSLNTIENGYVSFPDVVVKCHPDFRLVATANPQDEHHNYVGRNKLDAATLDRFDIIPVELDSNLEKSLVSKDIYRTVQVARMCLKEINSSIEISMRDSMRYQKRRELKLDGGFAHRLMKNEPIACEKFDEIAATLPKHEDQSDCTTFEDLVRLLNSDRQSDEKYTQMTG